MFSTRVNEAHLLLIFDRVQIFVCLYIYIYILCGTGRAARLCERAAARARTLETKFWRVLCGPACRPSYYSGRLRKFPQTVPGRSLERVPTSASVGRSANKRKRPVCHFATAAAVCANTFANTLSGARARCSVCHFAATATHSNVFVCCR